MYIERQKKEEDGRRIREDELFGRREKEQPLLIEEHEDFLISEHSKDVLMSWKAPEFEVYERDKKWYIIVTAILAVVIIWALVTNSPIMAITFILIGALGYMYINKEPRMLNFTITYDGIYAGREFYSFDDLHSFWVFYEPEGKKAISLHTHSHLVPFVHIPVHNEDPSKIREMLVELLAEEKHQEGMVEMLERLLRL